MSSNRHNRRATESFKRRQERKKAAVAAVSGDPQSFVSVKDANAAFQQVHANLEGIARMMAQNNHAVMTGFGFTEAHLFVQKRVLNDQAKGCVRMTPRPPEVEAEEASLSLQDELAFMRRGQLRAADDEIDWEWYHWQYHVAQAFFVLIDGLTKWAAKEAPPAPEPTIEETTDDTVFGGDYATALGAPG